MVVVALVMLVAMEKAAAPVNLTAGSSVEATTVLPAFRFALLAVALLLLALVVAPPVARLANTAALPQACVTAPLNLRAQYQPG